MPAVGEGKAVSSSQLLPGACAGELCGVDPSPSKEGGEKPRGNRSANLDAMFTPCMPVGDGSERSAQRDTTSETGIGLVGKQQATSSGYAETVRNTVLQQVAGQGALSGVQAFNGVLQRSECDSKEKSGRGEEIPRECSRGTPPPEVSAATTGTIESKTGDNQGSPVNGLRGTSTACCPNASATTTTASFWPLSSGGTCFPGSASGSRLGRARDNKMPTPLGDICELDHLWWHPIRIVSKVLDLNMDGSPGYPLCRDYTTNREIVERKGVFFLVNLVRERVEKFRLTGFYDDDCIRYFIKAEAHVWAKVEQGRYRLIASVSVVDQLIDSLLFDDMLDAEVKASRYTPIKNGRSFLYGGLDDMFKSMGWNSNTEVCFKDVSAWDWHVRDWMYDLYYETTLRLCNNWPSNPNNLYTALMRERLMCLMYAKCMTSDGTQYQQLLPGTVRSGSKITLSQNTRCSIGDKIDGAIQHHGDFKSYRDGIMGIGDDTIEIRSIPESVTLKTAKDQGRTLKHCHSAYLYAEGPNRPEWCSKNWKIGPYGKVVWWSINWKKFCFNLVNLEKISETEYAAEKLFGACIEYYWDTEHFKLVHAELMKLRNAAQWQRSPAWFEYLHTGNESLTKTMRLEESSELYGRSSKLCMLAEKLVLNSCCPVMQRLVGIEENPGPITSTATYCVSCDRSHGQDLDCIFYPSVGMNVVIGAPIAGLAAAAGLTYALKDYKVTNENYIAKGFQWAVDNLVPQAVKDWPSNMRRSDFNKWLHPSDWKYIMAQDEAREKFQLLLAEQAKVKGKMSIPKPARKALQEIRTMLQMAGVEQNPGPKKGQAKKIEKKVEAKISKAVVSKIGKGPHTALFERLMGHGHKKRVSGKGHFRDGNSEYFVCRTKLANMSITGGNTQGDLLLKMQLNPKMLALAVKVLAIEEQLWEKFVDIEGAFHVIPSVPYTSTTSLVHYVDRDPTDADPIGAAAIDSALNHGGRDFSLKEGGTMPFKLKGNMFVDASTTDTGADLRQQSPGTYRLYVDVKPSASETVAIWATFKIHFKIRQLDVVESPVTTGTGMLEVRTSVVANILATDPCGFAQTVTINPLEKQHAAMASCGHELYLGSDGVSTVIGIPDNLTSSGKMLRVCVTGNATTSCNYVKTTDFNMTEIDIRYGIAGAAFVLNADLALDASSASNPTNITFAGSRMTHVLANGTLTDMLPQTVLLWHWIKFTGTFTAPLLTATFIGFSHNTAASIADTWHRLGPGTVENKVLRESYEQKLHTIEEREKWLVARYEEILGGDSVDKLKSKVKFLEDLLDVKKDSDSKDHKRVTEGKLDLPMMVVKTPPGSPSAQWELQDYVDAKMADAKGNLKGNSFLMRDAVVKSAKAKQ